MAQSDLNIPKPENQAPESAPKIPTPSQHSEDASANSFDEDLGKRLENMSNAAMESPTDFNSSDEEGFWSKIKLKISGFFVDRRRTAIIIGVFVFVAAIIAAFLLFGGGKNKSTTAAATQDRGQLPLAGTYRPSLYPKVFRPADGTLLISWETKVPTDGRVSYGTTTEYGFYADDQKTLQSADYDTQHEILLRDLEPDSTYHLFASSLDRDGKILYSDNIEAQPIADTIPPDVRFVNVNDGSNLSGLACIEINATDDQGVYSLVLQVDSDPVIVKRSDFHKPFCIDTNKFGAGSHTLTAIASDGANKSQAAAAVAFTNENPGDRSESIQVQISTPGHNARVSGSVPVKATATGAPIGKMVAYLDGIQVRESISSSIDFSLTTTSYRDGEHNIWVKAISLAGKVNWDSVNVVFDNIPDDQEDGDNDEDPDPNDPGDDDPGDDGDDDDDFYGCTNYTQDISVALTSPQTGITLNGNVSLAAQVSAGDFQISRVVFTINDLEIGRDRTAPYEFTLRTQNYVDGAYEIGAVAVSPDGTCGRISSEYTIDNSSPNSALVISNVSALGSENSIQMSWKTNKNATSVVKYGISNLNQSESKDSYTSNHNILIQNLQCGTTYNIELSGVDRNNTAATPYQTTANTTACGGDGGNDGGKPQISNVKVYPTSNSLLVEWTTNIPADSMVEYGVDKENMSAQDDNELTTSHGVFLPNLNSSTTYNLRIISTSGNGIQSDPYNTTAATLSSGTTITPANCSVNGFEKFYACYFNDMGFGDEAAKDTTGVVRIDLGLAEDESPHANVDPLTYSIAWKGEFMFEAGEYEFILRRNDGARLFINNNIVLDAWQWDAQDKKTSIFMEQGINQIQLDYYQNNGGAEARLNWQLKNALDNPPGKCTKFDSSLSATILSPQSGAVLSGIAGVRAAANIADFVDFYVDDSSEPFAEIAKIGDSFQYPGSLDTRQYNNGGHVIIAVARMNNGRCSTWSSEGPHAVNVSFDNSGFKINNVDAKTSESSAMLNWGTSNLANSIIYVTNNRSNFIDPKTSKPYKVDNQGNFVDSDGKIVQVNSFKVETPSGNTPVYNTTVTRFQEDPSCNTDETECILLKRQGQLKANSSYYFRIISLEEESARLASTEILQFFTKTEIDKSMTAAISWESDCRNKPTGILYYDSAKHTTASGADDYSAYEHNKVQAARTGSEGDYDFTAVLKGLLPDTTYYYWFTEFKFTASPLPNEPGSCVAGNSAVKSFKTPAN